MEPCWPMYMYIAWIQIHGTTEPWNCGSPCICIFHESRFMEAQNHGNVMIHVYVYSMNPDSWNCRTMKPFWPMYMYIWWIHIHGTAETWKHSGICNCTYMYNYTTWIQIHGTAELWKHGDPCMYMDLWNYRYMKTRTETWIHVVYINVPLFTTAEPWKRGTVYTWHMLYKYLY